MTQDTSGSWWYHPSAHRSYIWDTRPYPAGQGSAKTLLSDTWIHRNHSNLSDYVPARQFENRWFSADFMLGYGLLSKNHVFLTSCKNCRPKCLQNESPMCFLYCLTWLFECFFWNLQNHDFKLPVDRSMCRGFIYSSQQVIILLTPDERTKETSFWLHPPT